MGRRIADNTFGTLLLRLDSGELVGSLVRMVKAEARRKNLGPVGIGAGVVAIDGKHVATLGWKDMCRSLEVSDEEVKRLEWEKGWPAGRRRGGNKQTAVGLKQTPKNIKWLRAKLAEVAPQVQLVVPEDGAVYGKVRMHTVTLVSSGPGVCIYQRMIPGATNEIGAMGDLIEELRQAYGRTALFCSITTDAGNISVAVGAKIRQCRWHCFSQIKSNCGKIHAEALRLLGSRTQSDTSLRATCSDKQNGQVVTYFIWGADLGPAGWLDWSHARQLFRVRRVCVNIATGEVTTGDRYYVTSQRPDKLDAERALQMSRSHWRCENNTHWTSDAVLGEDRRRHMWSRHANGVAVVAALRGLALFILAMARWLSSTGYDNQRPSWQMVIAHFHAVLCGGLLDTTAFDTV